MCMETETKTIEKENVGDKIYPGDYCSRCDKEIEKGKYMCDECEKKTEEESGNGVTIKVTNCLGNPPEDDAAKLDMEIILLNYDDATLGKCSHEFKSALLKELKRHMSEMENFHDENLALEIKRIIDLITYEVFFFETSMFGDIKGVIEND